MTSLWRRVAPDCPRNPPKPPPETTGTLVVCTGQIVLRRTPETATIRGRADVAQLVEHLHGKQEVPGSNPGVGFAFSACWSQFRRLAHDSGDAGRLRSNLLGMAAAERIEVADAPDRERYELSIDGEVVGFTAYRARTGLIAFVHTEVDERLQGHGLADRLIRFALEDARARGLAVLPFCPFVKAFIERHREFEALVPDSYREQFGL